MATKQSAAAKKKAAAAKKKAAAASKKKAAASKAKASAKKKAAASKKKAAATKKAGTAKKAAAKKAPAKKAAAKKAPAKKAAAKKAPAKKAAATPDAAAVNKLDSKIASLEKALAAAADEARDASARAAEADEARTRAEQRGATQTRALDKARADIDRLEAEVAATAALASDDKPDLQRELAEAQARMTDLESRTKAAESMRADLQNQLKQANQAKINAREQLAAAKLRGAELATELESALADAKPVDDAGSMISKMRRESDEMRNRALRAEAELAQEKRSVQDLSRQTGAKNMLCPRCGEKMQEFRHHGVTLDRCTGCVGLYFDAGELEQVVRAELSDGEVLEMVAEMPEDNSRRGFWGSLFSRWRDDSPPPPSDGD